MHEQQPAPGGLPARPDGNRPANNARLSTPGTVGASSFKGGTGATDFLGLGEELGAVEPQAPPPAQPARTSASPSQAVWDEYDPQGGKQEVVSLDDEVEDEAPARGSRGKRPIHREEQEEEAPEEGVLAAWKEDEPVARGRGRLAGLCAGVAIAGMLTVALLKLVSSSKSTEEILPEPLAAHRNALPGADELTAPVPTESHEPKRMVYDAQGQAQPTEARPELVSPPQDPATAARERFEATRGDAPPPGFDPSADAPPPIHAPHEEPAYETSPLVEPHVSAEQAPAAGETAVASASPGASAPAASASTESAPSQPPPIEIAPGALAAQSSSAATAGEAPVEIASAAPAAASAHPIELVGAPPQGGMAASAGSAPPPSVATSSASSTQPASTRSWLDLAALRAGRQSAGSTTPEGAPAAAPSSDAAVASATESATSQPAPLPAPTQPVPASATASEPAPAPQSAVEQLLAAREPRANAIASDPPVPPETNPGLRQASTTDYKGVWQSPDLPGTAQLSANPRLLTPNVGRVRAVLKSGDVFEGRLFAIGEGNLWLESPHGRMGLSGERLASLEQLVTPEGTPALGDPGSQALAGMERVRVKTPGGVFYGKVIARDAERTTIVTDDGARLTLESKMVELLVDAPKVTIKGAAPEGEAKQPPAPKKKP